MHRHKSVRQNGPYCCAGSVAWISVCACGCKRRTCDCHQCRTQHSNDSGWYMPRCGACGMKHSGDVACSVAVA